MTKKINLLVAMAACLLGWQTLALAQVAPAGMLSLGIGKVKVLPSVQDKATTDGTLNSLNRVVEAMDSQLIDRLHNTRKFTLVSRSDLDEVMKEQKLTASGNVDDNDQDAAQAFRLAGCKYLLVTTVDNFQDYQTTVQFQALGETASKRVVQFSAVAKLYDTTSGKILETANLQLNNGQAGSQANMLQQSNGADLSDALLQTMSRMMAQKVSDRVIDVLRPARILARTDNIVTINRGDGTDIQVNDMWNVFAQGKELIDPDTGASLGREEVRVGTVRIVEVDPLFSKGEVVEDHGVDTGQVLRFIEPTGDPNQPPPGGGAPQGPPPQGPPPSGLPPVPPQ
jgi:curli biogenesis system outer membrane secretion channel CsgG